MGLNTIGSIFMPKNKVFYELFEKVADTVQEMGQQLLLVVKEPNRSLREPLIKYTEDLEHRNDDHTHQIFTELGRNFITPFDREDIHYLTSTLDDICDHIYSAAKKISFYNVDPSDEGIQKLAILISEGCEQVKIAVYGLRDMNNLKQMTDALVKINLIENQADDVFDLSVENLFEFEEELKQVIKKKEIYQVLEIATDKCEDAANVIENIIIKYA